MLLALRKRPVSVEQVDAALERIHDKLLAGSAKEVPSARLGELLMRELKKIDKVAYVRFASVYRSFSDVEEFEEELERLEHEPPLPRGQASLDEHMFDSIDDPQPTGRRLRALAGGLTTASSSEQEDSP